MPSTSYIFPHPAHALMPPPAPPSSSSPALPSSSVPTAAPTQPSHHHYHLHHPHLNQHNTHHHHQLASHHIHPPVSLPPVVAAKPALSSPSPSNNNNNNLTSSSSSSNLARPLGASSKPFAPAPHSHSNTHSPSSSSPSSSPESPAHSPDYPHRQNQQQHDRFLQHAMTKRHDYPNHPQSLPIAMPTHPGTNHSPPSHIPSLQAPPPPSLSGGGPGDHPAPSQTPPYPHQTRPLFADQHQQHHGSNAHPHHNSHLLPLRTLSLGAAHAATDQHHHHHHGVPASSAFPPPSGPNGGAAAQQQQQPSHNTGTQLHPFSSSASSSTTSSSAAGAGTGPSAVRATTTAAVVIPTHTSNSQQQAVHNLHPQIQPHGSDSGFQQQPQQQQQELSLPLPSSTAAGATVSASLPLPSPPHPHLHHQHSHHRQAFHQGTTVVLPSGSVSSSPPVPVLQPHSNAHSHHHSLPAAAGPGAAPAALYDIGKLLAAGCVVVSGRVFSDRGHNICGVLNQHNRPCKRIGKCPFHLTTARVSASNSCNGYVDASGNVGLVGGSGPGMVGSYGHHHHHQHHHGSSTTTTTLTTGSTTGSTFNRDGTRADRDGGLATTLTTSTTTGSTATHRLFNGSGHHHQYQHHPHNVVPLHARKLQCKHGWSKEEHYKFLRGLQKYSRGSWKQIALFVKTRTPTQVQSHAQKYFLRQTQRGKKKCSIHDLGIDSPEMREEARKFGDDDELEVGGGSAVGNHISGCILPTAAIRHHGGGQGHGLGLGLGLGHGHGLMVQQEEGFDLRVHQHHGQHGHGQEHEQGGMQQRPDEHEQQAVGHEQYQHEQDHGDNAVQHAGHGHGRIKYEVYE